MSNPLQIQAELLKKFKAEALTPEEQKMVTIEFVINKISKQPMQVELHGPEHLKAKVMAAFKGKHPYAQN